jgi:hypothetical protein
VNEDAVRQIVRDVVARRLAPQRRPAPAPPRQERHVETGEPPVWRAHVSHGRFTLAGGDKEGRCLVEPSVRCSHCGYCQSYGH